MLSTEYGFDTSVKRSGHAACWCAALGGVVQFGGWPPSEMRSEVVRHEGSRCPLFVLPATTIARHVHRADQRREKRFFDVALAPHRQRRLQKLCDIARGVAPCDYGERLRKDEEKRSSRLGCDTKERDKDGGILCESLNASSSASSALSPTTEDLSECGFEYDEGYMSEQEVEDETARSRSSPVDTLPSLSSSRRTSEHGTSALQPLHLNAASAGAPDQFATDAANEAVAPQVAVELLRQVDVESGERVTHNTPASLSAGAPQDHTSMNPSTRTGYVKDSLRVLTKGRSDGHVIDKEAPSVQADTREVRGKHTVRPLVWKMMQPPVAPRSRHGHHLVCCGERLYVIGGSYWAHGNTLALTDMVYDVRMDTWQQIPSLFPPRFAAALAKSNTTPDAPSTPQASSSPCHLIDESAEVDAFPTGMVTAGAEQQVLYYFGGLSYCHQLMNTLHRLWLPQKVLEELPQYGEVPRAQFKGILVCDVQRERSPKECERREPATGRLFYMDGFQDGRPMAPYLRVYNLATGVWVRVCPSPDLVSSQISLLQYELVDAVSEGIADEALILTPVSTKRVSNESIKLPATRLRRFKVVGGMPSRRGKQRRSRTCYSFDTVQMRFDYSHALPVPGLTAHCVVPLPSAGVPNGASHSHSAVKSGEDRQALEGSTTLLSAYKTALSVLREQCGAWSLCCGGSEDGNDATQDNLGKPVGWVYLLAPRRIPLAEAARVQVERLGVPSKVLTMERDELLGTLF